MRWFLLNHSPKYPPGSAFVHGNELPRAQCSLLRCVGQIRLAEWSRAVRSTRDTVLRVATEREKMLAGEMYDPLDPELVAARGRARDLCQHLNTTSEADDACSTFAGSELVTSRSSGRRCRSTRHCIRSMGSHAAEEIMTGYQCVRNSHGQFSGAPPDIKAAAPGAAGLVVKLRP